MQNIRTCHLWILYRVICGEYQRNKLPHDNHGITLTMKFPLTPHPRPHSHHRPNIQIKLSTFARVLKYKIYKNIFSFCVRNLFQQREKRVRWSYKKEKEEWGKTLFIKQRENFEDMENKDIVWGTSKLKDSNKYMKILLDSLPGWAYRMVSWCEEGTNQVSLPAGGKSWNWLMQVRWDGVQSASASTSAGAATNFMIIYNIYNIFLL